jgi:hypothetical protein
VQLSDAHRSAAKEAIILPAEDRNRMARLYEEVLTRVEEMAMITARTLKIQAGARVAVRFNPLVEGTVDFTAVEIVRTPQSRGCYDYREGACFKTMEHQRSEAHNEVM